MGHSAQENRVFRYVGGLSFSTTCDDCGAKATRLYETGKGYEYLCAACGNDMEQTYKNEQYEINREKKNGSTTY